MWKSVFRRFCRRRIHWAPAALYVAVALATFLDYGPTADEQNLVEYGSRLVRWYASLGRDRAALSWGDHHNYGALFELLAQAAGRVSRLGLYETRHLVNAAFGAVALAAAAGLGRRLAGPLGGALSGSLLVLHPGFYGHTFNNPKDVPFAALYAVAVWAAARDVLSPRGAVHGAVTTGVAIGLALGMRVGSVVLLPATAALWTAAAASNRPAPAEIPRLALALLGRLAGVTLVAWLVMLLFWPYAQVGPLRHPVAALGMFQSFHPEFPSLFDGVFLRADELPWDYLPRWLALTWPDVYFAVVPLGLLLPAARLVKGGPASGRRRWMRALVAAWLAGLTLFPVAWVMLRRPPLYDAMRHFLFVVPGLAVVAGVGTTWALGALRRGAWRAAALVFLLVLAAPTVRDMVELHPYQAVYFNRWLAGGLAGADGRYETDYWGLSYKEGVEWVLRHYQGPYRRPVRVANTTTCFLTAYFLDRAERRHVFLPVCDDESRPPHLVLATTRGDRHKAIPGRIVHRVNRQGVTLCYVIEVRPPWPLGMETPPRRKGSPVTEPPPRDEQPR